MASTNSFTLFVFFSFSVQGGWLSFGNELFWIVVTDNGVTQSVVLKEPFWNFDGRCDKSPIGSCFPQQRAARSQSTAESTPASF